MTQENKELLLKDLCSRLPYGVKVSTPDDVSRTITRMNIDRNLIEVGNYIDDVYVLSDIKPYLFPLSSMNRAQREEFVKFADYEPRLEDCGRHQELYYYDLVGHENNLYPNSDAIDWLDKNHFDYRGLIPMGLAIDATNLNIY